MSKQLIVTQINTKLSQRSIVVSGLFILTFKQKKKKKETQKKFFSNF